MEERSIMKNVKRVSKTVLAIAVVAVGLLSPNWADTFCGGR